MTPVTRIIPVALVATVVALLAWPVTALALNPNHQCIYCHQVHNLMPPENLTENLCLTCHGPGGISTLKATVHANKVGSKMPPFRISCMDCHDSHSNRVNHLGGTNIKLVGINVDGTGVARLYTPASGTREVVFESRGTDVGAPSLHSFADSDEDNDGYYDGVCETCHTLVGRHNNYSDSAHNTGKTCTLQCHLHTTGFNRR